MEGGDVEWLIIDNLTVKQDVEVVAMVPTMIGQEEYGADEIKSDGIGLSHKKGEDVTVLERKIAVCFPHLFLPLLLKKRKMIVVPRFERCGKNIKELNVEIVKTDGRIHLERDKLTRHHFGVDNDSGGHFVVITLLGLPKAVCDLP